MKYVEAIFDYPGNLLFGRASGDPDPVSHRSERLWSGDNSGRVDHEADPTGKGGDRSGFPRGCHVHYVCTRYRGNHGKCGCFKRDAASHLRDHGGIHGTDHDCDRSGIPAYYPGAENEGAAAMQTVGTKAAADDKEDRLDE